MIKTRMFVSRNVFVFTFNLKIVEQPSRYSSDCRLKATEKYNTSEMHQWDTNFSCMLMKILPALRFISAQV